MARTKLKIAFIGARGVGNSYGGIETYYEEVGSRLVQRGHQVFVYCRKYFTPAVTHSSRDDGQAVALGPKQAPGHIRP